MRETNGREADPTTVPDDVGAPSATVRRGRPGYERREVLDIAVDVFIRQGYDATSIAMLAERLGLSKSALYHHFDSKEQILGLALDQALDALEGALADAQRSGGDAGERLELALGGAVAVLVEQFATVTLLLRVRGNSEVERHALERRRSIDRELIRIVREAQAEGSIRGDVDAGIVARLLFGMVNSMVEWYQPAGEERGSDLARDVLTIAMDGLRTRSGA